jgi:fatty-acyl-CoA synthase
MFGPWISTRRLSRRDTVAADSKTLRDSIEDLDDAGHGFHFVGEVECRDMSLSDVRTRSFAIASAMADIDVHPGDRVLLILPKEEQFIQMFLGAICAGVIPVPIFPPFMLNQLDAYRRHLELVARVSGARTIVTSAEMLPFLQDLTLSLRLRAFDDLRSSAVTSALPAARPDDIALLQFTSGSTAAPRGVAVTHRSLLANMDAVISHTHSDPEADRGVTWLPLYHDMGLGAVIMGVVGKGSVWYISPLDFVRRPQIWCETISAVKGTVGFAPNFAYGLIARRASDEEVAGWDLSSWRIAGCGAEPVQPDTLRTFAARLAPAGFDARALFPCYGLAESTLAASFPAPGVGLRTMLVSRERLSKECIAAAPIDDEPTLELAGCGTALAHHEIAVIDESGRRQPSLHEGEILLRGPSVAAGYYGDDSATAAVFSDGWLHTQDLGFLHRGELFVTGRKKDLIILHGRNYYPHDIEWCAQDVPGVRRGNVVAFACPNQRDEDIVVIVAEARHAEGVDKIPLQVRAHVRAHLGIVIDDVVVIEKDSLSKTTSGKVRRAETRSHYLARSLRTLDSPRDQPAPVRSAGQAS